ncbi:MAG: hypothetical protein Q9209_000358 [Squamulea sp. 1 TL-2023]
MVPTTCSYRPPRSKLTIGSFGKSDIDVIDETDDIHSILDDQWHGYGRYMHDFPIIRDKIPLMAEEAKDGLAKTHKEFWYSLLSVRSNLRAYYFYINHHGKILQRNNTVSPQFKTALAGAIDRHDLWSRQKLIDDFISDWRNKYDILVTPGVDLAAYIDYDRHQLIKLRIGLMEARENTAKARQDVMNKWPLAKRITQDTGFRNFDEHENFDYNYALEFLDPWIKKTISLENILTLAWTNITAIHQNLATQIVTSFLVDSQSHFGPDAPRDLQTWIVKVRQGGWKRM